MSRIRVRIVGAGLRGSPIGTWLNAGALLIIAGLIVSLLR